MMARAHACGGAAAWLASSQVGECVGYHQHPATVAVGVAMCAGGALFPDLDLSGRVTSNEGGAAVAKTFGVLSLFVAECVEKVSLGVYEVTRSQRDLERDNGHRTLTHSLIFNVAAGFGVYALVTGVGRWAVLGVLFVTLATAVRGLFGDWAARQGWIITTLAAVVGVGLAFLVLPAGSGALLGAAVGVGGLAHVAGDMLTEHGCPVLWPIPIRGRRWYCVGIPNLFAVKVGGRVEHWFVTPLLVLAGVAAVVWPWVVPLFAEGR